MSFLSLRSVPATRPLVTLLAFATVGCTAILGGFEVTAGDGGAARADAGGGGDGGAPGDGGGAGDGGPSPDGTAPAGNFEAVLVAAGRDHTCAMRAGEVFCWGQNDKGQLGRGGVGASTKPLKIPNFGTGAGASKAIGRLVAGAQHTCAIDADQKLFCWGANDAGQLGTGETPDSNPHPDPRPVAGGVPPAPPLGGVTAVALGPRHTCAIAGDVYCWGANNDGAAGFTNPGSSLPVKVPNVVGAIGISAGPGHTCAWSSAKAWCWGLNTNGQLGQPSAGAAPLTPTEVPAPAPFVAIGAGGEAHTCMLSGAPAQVRCFGRNNMGQAGVPGSADIFVPTPIGLPPSPPKFDDVATGGSFSCARAENGNGLGCFGSNLHGQLALNPVDGNPHHMISLVPPSPNTTIRSFSLGFEHGCATLKGPSDLPGPVICWGGAGPRLGFDNNGDQTQPKAVQHE